MILAALPTSKNPRSLLGGEVRRRTGIPAGHDIFSIAPQIFFFCRGGSPESFRGTGDTEEGTE
jgi:hypothetical protein